MTQAAQAVQSSGSKSRIIFSMSAYLLSDAHAVAAVGGEARIGVELVAVEQGVDVRLGIALEHVDRAGIDLGLSKNIVDITCVTLTCIMSMTVAHRILGVGPGTLIAMLGIGRVIAFVNKLFGERLALLLSDAQL